MSQSKFSPRSRRQRSKKQLIDAAGKCPLFSQCYTYIRRKDQSEWLSDRMTRCENFVRMPTSWGHHKVYCPSDPSVKTSLTELDAPKILLVWLIDQDLPILDH